MRGRNKSLLEDVVIVSILGTIIFGIYTLFFHSEEINEIKEETQAIEKKVENQLEKIPNMVKIESVVNEIKKTEEIKQEETQKTNITETANILEERIISKESKTQTTPQQTQELDEKAKIELFYKTIRDKIYINLEKSLDKSTIKSDEFVNIKLTILKDGRYEQLTLIEGNKEYFELIKPSITQSFPVNMDDSLRQNFPRYFRMKIEFK